MPKVWLLTGSSRGLGRAFAEATLEAGENVAVTARRVESIADLKKRFGNKGVAS